MESVDSLSRDGMDTPTTNIRIGGKYVLLITKKFKEGDAVWQHNPCKVGHSPK